MLMDKLKNIVGKIQDYSTYKIMAISALLELITSVIFLGYIYSIENSALRPIGTFLMAFIICLVIIVVNACLALVLFLESKFRKNFRDIKRLKYTHWGFALFVILTLLSLFWFVLNMIFSLM